MKVSKYFDLRELVHPDLFNHPAIGSRSIDFINNNTLSVLDELRADFGAITVNNWHIGGKYKNSGLRLPDSTVGAKLSAHRFGTGFDLKFSDTHAEKVYFYILNNQYKYKFISRMENAERTVSWLHIEICSEPRIDKIVVFNP